MTQHGIALRHYTFYIFKTNASVYLKSTLISSGMVWPCVE